MIQRFCRYASLIGVLLIALVACNPPAVDEAPAEADAPNVEANVEANVTTLDARAAVQAVYTRPQIGLEGLPDLEGRTVVAVTGNDYVPFNYVDPLTGEAEGWEYDAINEACRRLNCEVQWEVTAWETMIQAVADGQYDIGMDGITITEERAEQVDFSIPYIRSQQFMLVRADEERFATPEEFAADEALRVGAQAGTTGFFTAIYEILDGDESNERVQLFDNFGASVQALISGDVDLVLVDAASGEGYIGANPDALKLVGDPLATEDFGFIFTPGSDLVDPFDAAITTMQRDGFFSHLSTKWFFLNDPNGEDLYDQLPDLDGQVVAAVTANDYIPLNFIDPQTGAAMGWEYDAVNEVCRRLNCVVDWNAAAWETMIQAVNAGQFDVGMDGITITEERAEQVGFSMPYMTMQQFMLTRADEDRFADAAEFAADENLRIGAQAGTTGFFTAVYDILDGDENNERIILFDSFGAAVQALIQGDVDMVLVDTASGKGYIGANPDALKLVGAAQSTEEFGFIYPLESELVAPFDTAIASMIRDNYTTYLSNKWFYLYDFNQE